MQWCIFADRIKITLQCAVALCNIRNEEDSLVNVVLLRRCPQLRLQRLKRLVLPIKRHHSDLIMIITCVIYVYIIKDSSL